MSSSFSVLVSKFSKIDELIHNPYLAARAVLIRFNDLLVVKFG